MCTGQRPVVWNAVLVSVTQSALRSWRSSLCFFLRLSSNSTRIFSISSSNLALNSSSEFNLRHLPFLTVVSGDGDGGGDDDDDDDFPGNVIVGGGIPILVVVSRGSIVEIGVANGSASSLTAIDGRGVIELVLATSDEDVLLRRNVIFGGGIPIRGIVFETRDAGGGTAALAAADEGSVIVAELGLATSDEDVLLRRNFIFGGGIPIRGIVFETRDAGGGTAALAAADEGSVIVAELGLATSDEDVLLRRNFIFGGGIPIRGIVFETRDAGSGTAALAAARGGGAVVVELDLAADDENAPLRRNHTFGCCIPARDAAFELSDAADEDTPLR
ncbi:hypothetical protein AX774_g7472, partial [Zancudomyces culisetae]